MDNKQYIIGTILLLAGATGGYFISTHFCTTDTTAKPCRFKSELRKLWADHVFWTRDYIIAALADAPDKQAAANRLLKNQQELGNAIVPYYGNEAGMALAALLKDHILIAADLIEAAKKDDKTTFATLDQKWHANAADIAKFLSSANPYWPESDLLTMLNEHLSLTTQEVQARLQGAWEQDSIIFDKIFEQALMMADSLKEGIVKQFGNKF